DGARGPGELAEVALGIDPAAGEQDHDQRAGDDARLEPHQRAVDADRIRERQRQARAEPRRGHLQAASRRSTAVITSLTVRTLRNSSGLMRLPVISWSLMARSTASIESRSRSL